MHFNNIEKCDEPHKIHRSTHCNDAELGWWIKNSKYIMIVGIQLKTQGPTIVSSDDRKIKLRLSLKC